MNMIPGQISEWVFLLKVWNLHH